MAFDLSARFAVSAPSPLFTRSAVLRLQGGFYVATGIWPLAHLPSFEAVTGPKRDRWLVRTVGLLAAVIGASLLVSASRRREASPEALALAAGSAGAFAGVDVYYALRGRISRIYLMDALVEAGLLGALVLAGRARPAPTAPSAAPRPAFRPRPEALPR